MWLRLTDMINFCMVKIKNDQSNCLMLQIEMVSPSVLIIVPIK